MLSGKSGVPTPKFSATKVNKPVNPAQSVSHPASDIQRQAEMAFRTGGCRKTTCQGFGAGKFVVRRLAVMPFAASATMCRMSDGGEASLAFLPGCGQRGCDLPGWAARCMPPIARSASMQPSPRPGPEPPQRRDVATAKAPLATFLFECRASRRSPSAREPGSSHVRREKSIAIHHPDRDPGGPVHGCNTRASRRCASARPQPRRCFPGRRMNAGIPANSVTSSSSSS
jgi:hypothetical protein